VRVRANSRARTPSEKVPRPDVAVLTTRLVRRSASRLRSRPRCNTLGTRCSRRCSAIRVAQSLCAPRKRAKLRGVTSFTVLRFRQECVQCRHSGQP
jgi:hypothetical protein